MPSRAALLLVPAALLVGAGFGAPVAQAAAKPPAFHGTATLSTTGQVTVAWKTSAKKVTSVQVRVSARVGGKTVVVNAAGRYETRTSAVPIKGGASIAASAVTYRARLCWKAGSRPVCGTWSKAKHPAPVGTSVDASPVGSSPKAQPASTPATTPAVTSGAGPSLGGCPMLPADHAFNQDISSLPVDPRSSAYINAIGLNGHVHPDFGAADLGQGPGGFGIPYVVVPATQPLVPIAFGDNGFPDESDAGPDPVPLTAPVEGGNDPDGDRHVLAIQQGSCKLFELYRAFAGAAGWTVDGAATWDLATGVRTSGPHPGWTSADAAGDLVVASDQPRLLGARNGHP